MALTDKDVSTFDDIGANIGGFKAFGTDENGMAKEFQVAKFSDSVATSFDATRTSSNPYNVGDVVMYGGRLYRFTASHYGAWNASHVSVESAETAVKSIRTLSNAEFVYSIVDSNNVFLFGIKKDGSVEWAKGVPEPVKTYVQGLIDSFAAGKVDKVDGKSLINSVFANGVSVVTNEEFVFALVDVSDKFLFGIKKDGSVEWVKGVPTPIMDAGLDLISKKVDKVDGKSLVNSECANSLFSKDNPEFSKVVLDSLNIVLSAIRKDGTHVLNVPQEFNGDVNFNGRIVLGDTAAVDVMSVLKSHGFTGDLSDWSDSKSVHLPKPRFSILNISGIEAMPETKTDNLHAFVEFWDLNGNYFKKRAILNAQGSGSLQYPKKNAAIDLCNDEWIGDDTFEVKFGDWVPQDSFHIKAYYNDFFRGVGIAGFDVWKRMCDVNGVMANRTWKKATLNDEDVSPIASGVGMPTKVSERMDGGALCFPDGFPCLVLLNGSFYGLFAYNLKKHRDNYAMDKKLATNIHIDPGSTKSLFDFQHYPNIDWTLLEIRNPKSLICMDGSDYDGDNPAELIDATSPNYDGTNKDHKRTKDVKECIVTLRDRFKDAMELYRASDYAGCKSILEELFDVDNLLDYQLFIDFTQNADGEDKNWQWTTWDGVKWFVNPYDLDSIFGVSNSGKYIRYPMSGMTIFLAENPCFLAKQLYMSRMKEKYSTFRNLSVFDVNKVKEFIYNWMSAFTADEWKEEYNKWDSCFANLPTELNSGWEFVTTENGLPDCVFAETADNEYDSEATYSAGDVVSVRDSAVQNWFFKVRATQEITGVNPVKSYGACDSFWRLCKWLDLNISLRDEFYNYNQGA